MYITRFTDYALRVLLITAANNERLINIQDIAEYYDISKNHLTKVVPDLVRHGYLEALRGFRGGIRLAIPPEEICIGEVVRKIENLKIAECMREGNQCNLTTHCTLKVMFAGATEKFVTHLDQFTLADILNSKLLAELDLGEAPEKMRKSRPRERIHSI